MLFRIGFVVCNYLKNNELTIVFEFVEIFYLKMQRCSG